jgi:precorrin-2 dehydrogenase/sirohydrochlorin ferrochelatase
MIQEKLESLKKSGAVIRLRPEFHEKDAEDVVLIVADVKEDIAREIQSFGDRNRIFVNIVDKPDYCSFIVPAIVERGNLLIAISTSGSSPALAGWIRERFQQEFGPEYGGLLDALGETRNEVKKFLPRYGDRKAFYRHLLESGILRVASREGAEEAKKQLRRQLQEFESALQTRTET